MLAYISFKLNCGYDPRVFYKKDLKTAEKLSFELQTLIAAY